MDESRVRQRLSDFHCLLLWSMGSRHVGSVISAHGHKLDSCGKWGLLSSFSAWLLIAVASLVAQLVKNLPAVLETWVRPLGWEDPLEKGKATHSSIPGVPWWLRW